MTYIPDLKYYVIVTMGQKPKIEIYQFWTTRVEIYIHRYPMCTAEIRS